MLEAGNLVVINTGNTISSKGVCTSHELKKKSNSTRYGTNKQSEETLQMTYEPPLEDDIALDKEIEEEDDGYQEPDRMWGDE